jgi:hypothetical protein
MARMRAANIDTQNHIVTFSGNTHEQWYGAFPKGNRYIVRERARRHSMNPGEW